MLSDQNQSTSSPLLFSFVKKFKFNIKNLNYINDHGITPITAAIETNQQEIMLELLMLKANPLIENVHGNTALSLSQDKPFYLQTIEQSIESKTCEFLDCSVDKHFHYEEKEFKINKLILEGSCCLVAFELEDCNTSQKYFGKIKTKFGGLEIRNYIFLQEYIDLFMIKNLRLNFKVGEQKENLIKNTYCMIIKFNHGQALTVVLNSLETEEQKVKIIIAAITALAKLHFQGYIHNDALPNNCFWNPEQQIATFIDYDVMRTKQDLLKQSVEYLEQAEYCDFQRLIMGDLDPLHQKQITYGLSQYVRNISNVLLDLDDAILNPKFKNKLCSATIS